MITTSRLQVIGVTGGPLRITGASLVNGAYELATAGGADYELQTERQTTMDNILFIPGIANPVSEINALLFGAGQQGTFIAPSLTASLISGSTFGTGVETLPDLSPRNNPFSQATPSSRAAWFREPKRGRVNLLERTDEFDNAYWTKGNTTASGNRVTANAGTHAAYVERGVTNSNPSVAHTVSFIFLPTPGRNRYVWIGERGVAPIASATFDLDGVSVVGKAVAVTAAISLLPDGSVLCSMTSTTGVGATSTPQFALAGSTYTADRPSITWAGGEFLDAKAQYQIGSTATAYQRVTTAFDVTEQGQRDCYGVRADGTDDFYQRAIDFSGTEQMTVFAAVRKLSDAADGSIVEHTVGGLNGWFGIYAPGSGTVARFQYNTRGTSASLPFTTSTAFNAPITAIVTGQSRISTDLATLRINGTQVASSASDQGSGNYANATLNLFRREGGTMPFNGNLYALIVAGGSYPLSTIQRVERLLSRITPTVNL
jgi:hypothetical protein